MHTTWKAFSTGNLPKPFTRRAVAAGAGLLVHVCLQSDNLLVWDIFTGCELAKWPLDTGTSDYLNENGMMDMLAFDAPSQTAFIATSYTTLCAINVVTGVTAWKATHLYGPRHVATSSTNSTTVVALTSTTEMCKTTVCTFNKASGAPGSSFSLKWPIGRNVWFVGFAWRCGNHAVNVDGPCMVWEAPRAFRVTTTDTTYVDIDENADLVCVQGQLMLSRPVVQSSDAFVVVDNAACAKDSIVYSLCCTWPKYRAFRNLYMRLTWVAACSLNGNAR